MRFTLPGLLALGSAIAADAFRDTSPLFFFSTHEFETTSKQIDTAASVRDNVSDKLASCPSDFYILVSQPGVHVLDYTTRRSAPRLRERVLKKDEAVRSSFTISEVVGSIDTSHLQSTLESKCGAKAVKVDGASGSLPSLSNNGAAQVVKVDFPELPSDPSRADRLVDYDLSLAALIDNLPSSKYTVIYTTTSRGSPNLDNEIEEHLKIQAKRHAKPHRPRSDDEKDGNGKKLGLFEKYQFLSPGIFMGLMVVLFLLLILYVGISGLRSLQISYAAFDKANGPAAAAKKQQ